MSWYDQGDTWHARHHGRRLAQCVAGLLVGFCICVGMLCKWASRHLGKNESNGTQVTSITHAGHLFVHSDACPCRCAEK